ncbi:tail fiber protein [Cellulomonas sp.]|uniref:phage tail protein n=1 Tax=Cellulomonas sp. TaxID=40001 RepID=UPI001B28BC80|nr:tail fiber protein [Cellulomonas sp.]MBO9553153.1 phage tail protein [Cellulomonas sp.]
MATPYIGEIKMASFNFAPKGWALCNGQLLPINQNQALFSILGTTYGGDGRVNFALPNLQGRTPIHTGAGHTVGERGGEEAVTLGVSQLPAHAHAVAAAADANTTHPDGARFGTTTGAHYGPTGQVVMAPGLVASTGGGQAHPNMPPYLVVSFVIALQGIFPSQN